MDSAVHDESCFRRFACNRVHDRLFFVQGSRVRVDAWDRNTICTYIGIMVMADEGQDLAVNRGDVIDVTFDI